jgi:5-formyltetrahydrofolate cyclo-ligase
MTSKKELRITLKKFRQAFANKENIQTVFDQNAARIDHILTPAALIAGYVSFGSEVSPAGILTAAEARGAALALPHIGARGSAMTFKRWNSQMPLHRGAYGFDQPAPTQDNVAPDIILVPLVGFDRQMRRLGHGAGHYDRIFSIFPNALKIGIAWSCQEVSRIPTDSWDVALDAVLTEREWIVGPNSVIAQ